MPGKETRLSVGIEFMRKFLSFAGYTVAAFTVGFGFQIVEFVYSGNAATSTVVRVDQTGDMCAGQPKRTIYRADAANMSPVSFTPPDRSSTYTTGFALIQFEWDPADKDKVKPRCVAHRFATNVHSVCYVARHYCDYNIVPGSAEDQ